MNDTTISLALVLLPALAVLVTAVAAWELRVALRHRLGRPGLPTAFLGWCWRLFDRPAERRKAAAHRAQLDRALKTTEQLMAIAFAYTIVTQPAATRILERQTAAMRRAIAVWSEAA